MYGCSVEGQGLGTLEGSRFRGRRVAFNMRSKVAGLCGPCGAVKYLKLRTSPLPMRAHPVLVPNDTLKPKGLKP